MKINKFSNIGSSIYTGRFLFCTTTKKPKSDRSLRCQLNLEHSTSNRFMELLIFLRNPTRNSVNLILCVVFVFVAVIKVNGGLRQSRRAPNPSGTRPSSTPTFTDATSGNACSRSQCGISPESKRRRVNSWERWEIQHGLRTAAKSYRQQTSLIEFIPTSLMVTSLFTDSLPHLLLKYINIILIHRYKLLVSFLKTQKTMNFSPVSSKC